jgi:hypothetical protein
VETVKDTDADLAGSGLDDDRESVWQHGLCVIFLGERRYMLRLGVVVG